eukprot:3452531-Rhodomonas_salina.1
MCGTEIAYGTSRQPRQRLCPSGAPPIRLRPAYALYCTARAYGVIRLRLAYALSDLGLSCYAPTRALRNARYCHTRALQCPVLA